MKQTSGLSEHLFVTDGMHRAIRRLSFFLERPLEATQETDFGRLINRVPEVTLVFWILKILATTVGETAADVLSTTFKLGTVGTSYVMGALLLISLVFQLRAKRY